MNIQQLPCDVKAEKALIGSLIIDESIIDEYFDNFGVEEIFDTNNRIIITAIFELAVDGISVDLITLQNKLIEKKELEKIGGIIYLVEITTETPTSNNWFSYATIIQNLYKRRELIKQARILENSAFNQEDDLDNIVEGTYGIINKTLNEGKINSLSYMDIKKKIHGHIKENQNKGLLGYDWNVDFLNKHTGGIRKGKTYRIAGNSGIGKTNLFYHMIPSLLNQGAKILFISLENTLESTYLKIMSSVLGANPTEIERGNVGFDYEWLHKYKDKFFITDQIFDLDEIKREILKVKPDIVLLDYLQNVEVKGTKNSLEKLDKYAAEVKKFILRNQEIAWIDISQLTMGGDEKQTKRDGQFKGSGELKNAVDFGLHMFHYEPFYAYRETALSISENDKTSEELKNRTVVSFNITKNRLGPTGPQIIQGINFNEGIRYKEIPKEVYSLWT